MLLLYAVHRNVATAVATAAAAAAAAAGVGDGDAAAAAGGDAVAAAAAAAGVGDAVAVTVAVVYGVRRYTLYTFTPGTGAESEHETHYQVFFLSPSQNNSHSRVT